jgi:hypothetical protein
MVRKGKKGRKEKTEGRDKGSITPFNGTLPMT